jgi:hypothetical protein
VVPGDTESVHRVVRHLLDRDRRAGWRRNLVAHVDEAEGLPAPGFEIGSHPLAGADVLEVDAPVREARERVVGERD